MPTETDAKLLLEARELLPDAIALRRRIHAHPELGLELPQTRSAVLDSIADLELDVVESRETSGLLATLDSGRPGPHLLLRADMDALPMPEDTGLDFASTEPGRMHACGHDAHTAMLATAARLLHRRRDQLAGRVTFFFQPGEEGHFGAKRVLDEGLLEGERSPDAVFAIHIDPRLPVGRVASRPGPLLAAADVWSAELTGRGGHASMPHDTLDPVPVACEIVQALQTLVTRRIDAFDPVVLTVTKIEAGTTNNVIPESARLLGTLRSTSEQSRQRARDGIRRIIDRVSAAHEIEATIHIVDGYPVTVNEAAFTEFTREVTTGLLGEDAFLEMRSPVMGAEDFSYLLQRWPGAMVFLGVRPEGVSQPAPCHSNRMLLDEEGMAAGIALHAAMALRYLATA
ncbi:MAG: M20 family metallopeptidase [Proteobacteria bacterium]|nr:M20 family metallopeptidase [Pseudomonadota bacterium]